MNNNPNLCGNIKYYHYRHNLKILYLQSVVSISFLFSLLNIRCSGLTKPLLQGAWAKLGLPPIHGWLGRVVRERPLKGICVPHRKGNPG
jgi:hypothetical protein